MGVCDSRTGNLTVRFGPLHRSNARGVAVNQLPTAIPFHPDVCVSETNMSPVAFQNINDFRKTDHQANITIDLDGYVCRFPRLNLACARLVHSQFVGLCSDSAAGEIKDAKNAESFHCLPALECR